MCAEFSILSRDHRARHYRINAVNPHPVLGKAAPGNNVAKHGERDGRWYELVGDNPKHRNRGKINDYTTDKPAQTID